MRKFFSNTKLRSTFGFGKNDSNSTPQSLDEARALEETLTIELISCAAQAFSEGVQDVLYDSQGLIGDYRGFLTLLEFMEGDPSIFDIPSVRNSGGRGCLPILMCHRNNSRFVDTCNQAGLGDALIHVIRLLRMIEVKHVDVTHPDGLEFTYAIPTKKVKVKRVEAASYYVCEVLGTLCADPQTVDQLRASLIKLLTFPLCALPSSGQFLQYHVAGVLQRLCYSGLTNQIVWFLHDAQVILQMVRQFNDMVGMPSPGDEENDSLDKNTRGEEGKELRGFAAEQAGMWVCGCQCIVSVLLASAKFNSVLSTDFLNADGYALFSYIMRHTAEERITAVMNEFPKLFYCGDKLNSNSQGSDGDETGDDRGTAAVDGVVSLPEAGDIFADILANSITSLDSTVRLDFKYTHLMDISMFLYEKRKGKLNNVEFLVQNLAYTLLTTYSMSIRNCEVLESKYHFLPTMVLFIPTLASDDAVSAVMTLLNYVCQCADNLASFSVKNACAATTAIMHILLELGASKCEQIASRLTGSVDRKCTSSQDQEIARLCHRLSIMCGFFETSMKSNDKFSGIVAQCNLFRELFTVPFSLLNSQIEEDCDLSMQKPLMPVFDELIDFAVALQFDSSVVAAEFKICKLLPLCYEIIIKEGVSSDFINRTMKLFKAVGCCDVNSQGGNVVLDETLQLLLSCLQHPTYRCAYDKLTLILEAISVILLFNGKNAEVECARYGNLSPTFNEFVNSLELWNNLSGYDTILVVLISMHGEFKSKGDVASDATVLHDMFQCMNYSMSCLSFAFCATMRELGDNPDGEGCFLNASNQVVEDESEYLCEMEKLFNQHSRVGEAILNSGILSHHSYSLAAVDMLYLLIKGTSARPVIQNINAFCITLDMLDYMTRSARHRMLQKLIELVECSIPNAQLLGRSRVCMLVLDKIVNSVRTWVSESESKSSSRSVNAEEDSLDQSHLLLVVLLLKTYNQYIRSADILYILSHCVGCKDRLPSESATSKLEAFQSPFAVSPNAAVSDVANALAVAHSAYNGDISRHHSKQPQYPWQSIGDYARSSSKQNKLFDPVKFLSELSSKLDTSENVPYVCLGRHFQSSASKPRLPSSPSSDNIVITHRKTSVSLDGREVGGMQAGLDELHFHHLQREHTKPPCAYLAGHLSLESAGGRNFAASASGGGFSFVTWIRLPSRPAATGGGELSDTDSSFAISSRGSVVPLVAFSSLPDDCGFLEAHYDHVRGMVLVLVAGKSRNVEVFQFKSVCLLEADKWLNIALVVKRAKGFLSGSKSHVDVYFNGILSRVCDAEDIDIEFPNANSSVSNQISMFVGYVKMCTVYEVSPGSNVIYVQNAQGHWSVTDEEAIRVDNSFCEVSHLWHLGPTSLFDGVLLHNQVADIVLLGPSYCGTFKDVSMPLYESYLAYGTIMLSRYNLVDCPPEKVMQLLGYCNTSSLSRLAVDDTSTDVATAENGEMRDLEENPVSSNFSEISVFSESSSMPQPVLLISALNSATITVDAGNLGGASGYTAGAAPTYDPAKLVRDKARIKVLCNAALDIITEKSALPGGSAGMMEYLEYRNGDNLIFTPDSISSSLFALGNPVSLILPTVHQACSEEDLRLALELIKRCTFNHVANLRFMISCGYNMMAYMLSIKPKSIMNVRVLDGLFDIAVDTKKAYVSGNASVVTSLLANVAAFRCLLLNHKVWDISRYSMVNCFVINTHKLLMDPRFEALNCMRLNTCGVVQWLLMMLLAGSENCQRVGKEYAEVENANGGSVNSPSGFYKGSPLRGIPPNMNMSVNIDPKDDVWRIYCCNRTDADANETWDPFVGLVFSTIRRLITRDVRKADIECVAQSIVYTFSVTYTAAVPFSVESPVEGAGNGLGLTNSEDVNSTSQDGAESLMHASNKMEVEDNIEKDFGVDLLHPVDMIRIHMLKLLIYVYDVINDMIEETQNQSSKRNSSNTTNSTKACALNLKIFTTVLSPSWFFVVLEKSRDSATTSLAMRLLAMLMQTNSNFLNEFCSREGFNNLGTILTKVVQPLAVVLPLIGLLFRVPLVMLPQASQITDSDGTKLTKLIDLEEFQGPTIDEPMLTSFTLPVLSILLDLFAAACNKSNVPALVGLPDVVSSNTVILSMFRRSIVKCNNFRLLMQHRAAMELLSAAMFNCSNASDEYGSKIIWEFIGDGDDSAKDSADGLLTGVIDDYIAKSGVIERERNVLDVSHDFEAFNDNVEIELKSEMILADDGLKLSEILGLIVHDAVYDAKNIMILTSSLLSFPQHASVAFVRGFQSLIFEQIQVALDLVLKVPSLDTFEHLSSIFTLIVPLVKARVMDNEVLLQVLQFNIKAFEIISGGPISLLVDEEKGQERLLNLLRDFGSTARYLAIMGLYAGESNKADILSRISTMQFIRINLTLLCVSSFAEDASDWWSFLGAGSSSVSSLLFGRPESSSTGKILDGTAVLDQFHVPWMVGDNGASSTKQVDTMYNLAATEKQKISQLFVPLLLQACLTLAMDDNTSIRCEALRMCACLVISRKQYTEQVLTNLALAPSHDANGGGITPSVNANPGPAKRLSTFLSGKAALMEETVISDTVDLDFLCDGSSAADSSFSDNTESGFGSESMSPVPQLRSRMSAAYTGDEENITPKELKDAFLTLAPGDSTEYFAFLTGKLNTDSNNYSRGARNQFLPERGGNGAENRSRGHHVRRHSATNAQEIKDIMEREELVFAEFTHWLFENEIKVQNILKAIESSLGLLIPSTAPVSDVIVKLQVARKPFCSKARDDLAAMVSQTNEIRKCADSVKTIRLRSWLNGGTVDISQGALSWCKEWCTLQSQPIWGEVCCTSLSTVGKHAGVSSCSYSPSAEELSLNDDVVFNTPVDMNNKLLNGTALEENTCTNEVSAARVSALAAKAYRAQQWKLNTRVGPELCRKQLIRNFGESLEVDGMVAAAASHQNTSSTPMSSLFSPANVSVAGGDSFFGDEENLTLHSPVEESNFCAADGNIQFHGSPISNPTSFSSPGGHGNHELVRNNMEDFLQKIVKAGVIRKEVNTNTNANADAESLEGENDLIESESSDVETESDSDTDVDSSSEIPLKTETSANKVTNTLLSAKEGDAGSSVALALSVEVGGSADTTVGDHHDSVKSFGQGAPVTSIVQHLTSSEEDSSALTANLLNEVVCGIIGRSEWNESYAVNVQVIDGLEAEPALLVVTPKNVHILKGFEFHLMISKKGTQRVLEWTKLQKPKVFVDEKDNHQSTKWTRSNFKEVSAESNKFSKFGRKCFPTAKNVDESILLESIYATLLSTDNAYTMFPIDEIFIIYRHRYQLKDSGLEIKDISGLSMLFACCDANGLGTPETAVAILKKLIFEYHLPNSIYHKYISSRFTSFQLQAGIPGYRNFEQVYAHMMSQYAYETTKSWSRGEISNFEYLMHLNYMGGRSFHDLTQYPVFPWILSDYTSETLDLADPTVYRDLSKPMGALGEKRLQQFIERYRTMEEFVIEEKRIQRELQEQEGGDYDGLNSAVTAAPPFYYGTHYSCSGYVLNYLMRMQPFTKLAVDLQGGHFDVADRLFISIEGSWNSASRENLQDVRELIPEFFCCPDFLLNSNGFDFGCTQKYEQVNDVILPKWAHNDPTEFINRHREALESKYVSENLHKWIDLIFGNKQQGSLSVESYNVFIHLTYAGEVDVDMIDDPMLRIATISQIDNFGQTPTRVFNKPHIARVVPEVYRTVPKSTSSLATRVLSSDSAHSVGALTSAVSDQTAPQPNQLSPQSEFAGTANAVDSNALLWHSHLYPPLCAIGAIHNSSLVQVSFERISYPPSALNMIDVGVGDLTVNAKDKIIAVPKKCWLVAPYHKKYLKLSQRNGTGLGVYSVHSSNRPLDHSDNFIYFEMLHYKSLTCVTISPDGCYMLTGSTDMSVRLWRVAFSKAVNPNSSTITTSSAATSKELSYYKDIVLVGTFCGHLDCITCLDMSLSYNVVVSGSSDRSLMLWDLKTSRLIRAVNHFDNCLLSVSINNLSGHIVALTKSSLYLFNINGGLLAKSFLNHMVASTGVDFVGVTPATVGVAIPTPDWLEGVEAVTGHEGGLVCLWKLRRIIAAHENSNVSDAEGLQISTNELDSPSNKPSGSRLQRELYVCSTITGTHGYDITAVKLCRTSVYHSSNVIPNAHSGSSNTAGVAVTTVPSRRNHHGLISHLPVTDFTGSGFDLLVGDSGGFVSRWASVRPHSEK